MKYIKNSLLILIGFMLMGCDGEMYAKEKTIFAMDTVMNLKAYGTNADMALEEAQEEIYRLDSMLDRGDGEIALSENKKHLSDETVRIITTALEVSRKTDGMFDITVAPVMDLWGFYTKEYRVPQKEEIAYALKRVGYEKISLNSNVLTTEEGVCLDFGGIAKGYTSMHIKEIFNKYGIESGLVSLGGNVEAIGKKPDGNQWKVAIQSPSSDAEYAGIVNVSDKAVITSGDYQRFFEENGEKYHHIIDPATGYPAKSGLSSVTVISDNSTEADALSTALFVMGRERAEKYWRRNGGFDMVLITDDNEIYITEGVDFECGNDYGLIKR